MIDITHLGRTGSQILVMHFHFREILLKRKLARLFLGHLGLARTRNNYNVEVGQNMDRSSLGFVLTTGNNVDVEVGLLMNF